MALGLMRITWRPEHWPSHPLWWFSFQL